MKMNKLITSAFSNVGLHSLRLNRKSKREVYSGRRKLAVLRKTIKI